ncbi:MAG: hypothetical protein Kow00128_09370 [Deltaproteobacteria bacterium]
MRRAWTEWIGWLEENGTRQEDLRDLLPTCPLHLHAIFRQSRPDLAAHALHHTLALAGHRIRQGIQSASLPAGTRSSRHPIRRLFRGKRNGSDLRRAIGNPPSCPVCHRLRVARDRSLSLLFSLLQSPPHQARFGGGYGLCLRHFSRSLALKPTPRTGAILMETLAARLSLLRWELEESARKEAWIFRPEAPGTERTAWERAVRRFSGSFPDPETPGHDAHLM